MNKVKRKLKIIKKISLPPRMVRSLRAITRKGQSNARVIKRALILLALYRGTPVVTIAYVLDVSINTVKGILWEFRNSKGPFSITDSPRSGRKRKINQGHKTRIAALACSDPPEGFSRWSLNLLHEKVMASAGFPAISKESIRIVLETHDLKPWRQKMWCIPVINREYQDRMEDVLRLYERKYRSDYPVVCADEKPVMLHEDVRPFIPVSSGKLAKQDSEYIRKGSANVFCAVEPKKGRHITKVTENRKGPQFASFLRDISIEYPKAKRIHLVMDNLSTHGVKPLIDALGETEGRRVWSRFIPHYTPKHGSWLNMAEIEIGLFSRQCLGKRRIPSIKVLTRNAFAWNVTVNKRQTKINWTFTRKKARLKFRYRAKRSKTFWSQD